MPILIKLLWLVTTIAMGFFGYLLITILILHTGLFFTLETIQDKGFQQIYFGGGMWASIAGALTGLCYLFTDSEKRLWFLWAPFYIPMLYMTGVITYFAA